MPEIEVARQEASATICAFKRPRQVLQLQSPAIPRSCVPTRLCVHGNEMQPLASKRQRMSALLGFQ
ncbi:MAG: hypothetical protein VXZ35_07745 [Pseudomonadota bacterium]|nr:hypothetical protein [Pseudomonadota bacterium]